MKLGLIGKSIQYSLSPKIHTFWLEKYQIFGTYDLIDEAFEDILTIIKEQKYDGLNVTIPYKSQVLDLVPQWIGPLCAINTLKFLKNGSVEAKNTDFETALELFAKIKPERVIILGSGGAAQAMIYAAQSIHCPHIHVCSRTPLSGNFQWHDWRKRDDVVAQGGVLVNGTSIKDERLLGMWEGVKKLSHIIDLTYDLKEDPTLTRIAQANGIPLVTGKEFLIAQAQKSFAYWTGIMPEMTPDLLGSLL